MDDYLNITVSTILAKVATREVSLEEAKREILALLRDQYLQGKVDERWATAEELEKVLL